MRTGYEATGVLAGSPLTAPERAANREPWAGPLDEVAIQIALAQQFVLMRTQIGDGVDAPIGQTRQTHADAGHLDPAHLARRSGVTHSARPLLDFSVKYMM